MIKKLLSLSLLVVLITFPLNVFADDAESVDRTEPDENGCYYETIIEYEPFSSDELSVNVATKTRTGSKTVNYKNAAGTVMWYVKVSGKFTYGNGSSKCTSSNVTAESNNKSWKISSKSSSKSGSKASATATAKKYNNNLVIQTLTKKVTLTCSSDGTLS